MIRKLFTAVENNLPGYTKMTLEFDTSENYAFLAFKGQPACFNFSLDYEQIMMFTEAAAKMRKLSTEIESNNPRKRPTNTKPKPVKPAVNAKPTKPTNVNTKKPVRRK